MSVEKRVRAYLELAAKDAEAADLLRAGGNRYSAYHVQQAARRSRRHCLFEASKAVSSIAWLSYAASDS